MEESRHIERSTQRKSRAKYEPSAEKQLDEIIRAINKLMTAAPEKTQSVGAAALARASKDKKIELSKQEYAILRAKVVSQNADYRGNYPPIDTAFTANHFSIYENYGDDGFTVIARFNIENNRELINSIQGEINNDNIANAKEFDNLLKILKAKKRQYNGNTANATGGQSDSGISGVFGREQASKRGKDTSKSGGDKSGVNASAVETTPNGIRYSTETFDKQVDKVFDGTFPKRQMVKVADSLDYFSLFGFNKELPLLITTNHLINSITPEEVEYTEYHGLSVEQIKEVPRLLKSPVFIIQSLTKNSNAIILVLNAVDDKHRPLFAVVKNEGNAYFEGKAVDANILLSVYGRSDFGTFLNRAIQEEKIIYASKKRSLDLLNTARVKFPRALEDFSFNHILLKYNEDSKRFEKNSRKVQNNEKVRHSTELIDKYTETQYNNYGWARVNDVLTQRQNGDFNAKYAAIKRGEVGEIHKTFSGEYIVAVNDMQGASFGVNNVLVFAKGSFVNPVISKIIKINLDSETDIENLRSEIYAREQSWSRQSSFYANLYEAQLVTRYTREAFGNYKEIKVEREQSRRGQNGGTPYRNNQGEQNGRGNLGEDSDDSTVRGSRDPVTEGQVIVGDAPVDTMAVVRTELPADATRMQILGAMVRESDLRKRIFSDRKVAFAVNWIDSFAGVERTLSSSPKHKKTAKAKIQHLRSALSAFHAKLGNSQYNTTMEITREIFNQGGKATRRDYPRD